MNRADAIEVKEYEDEKPIHETRIKAILHNVFENKWSIQQGYDALQDELGGEI